MPPIAEAEYSMLALRTRCPDDAINPRRAVAVQFLKVFQDFIHAAKALDDLKKLCVYGKHIPHLTCTDGDTGFVSRAAVDPQVFHAILGIATEGGELVEALSATMIQGEPLDRTNLKEELGDLEWFEALLRSRLGLSADEIRTANIAKLEARYAKKKFDAEEALKRDHAAEREALK